MNGIKYKIIVNEEEFIFYAEKNFLVDDERILIMLKLVLNILSDVKQKLNVNKLKIKNIVLTKFISEGEKIVQENNIILNEEIKSIDGVGLKFKYNKHVGDDFVICSYFNDTNRIVHFLHDLSNNVDNLYNISLEQ